MSTKPTLIGKLLLMLAAMFSFTFAGGYQINEHGARATGMGGAFVARALDGSAIFFNPAGLGFQKGMNVSVGTTLIFPSTSFTGPTPLTTETKMKDQMFYPSNLYGTYAVNDQLVVGLGVFSPYGLGTEWDKAWIGKSITVKADIQTFYINPSVGYKINDQLSVGLGVSYVISNVAMDRQIVWASYGVPGSNPDGTFKLDGDGSGINANLGVIWKPTEQLSVGASYRLVTDIDYEGDATFSNVPALAAPNFPSGVTGKATLPMPSNLQVGAAYNVMENLTVEADFQYVGWSAYKELKIEFDKAVAGSKVQTAEKNWDDGILVRIGGEYALNDQLMVRAGYIRDMTPQPADKVEPMLPDADRNDISVGAGYKINENLVVDASFLMVLFEDRTSTYKPTTTSSFGGTYKSSASLISLNIGYQF